MVRPRTSIPARTRPRKRAAQPDSFLRKYYTLFNSLTRYARDDAAIASQPSRKRTSTSYEASKHKARKLHRLQQRYPVGGVSSYTWPIPFPQLPDYSQKPSERVDELVHQVVRDTFDSDYAMFRSPAWAKEHRITQEHMDRIVVDPQQVDESAAAAKALVETVLGRFITGVKRGAIGTRNSSAAVKGKDVRSSSGATTTTTDASETIPEAATASADVEAATSMDEPELDDNELDEEIGQPDSYALSWRQVLDYLESTAGSSKTAQWRNWHLLNAIAKTRQRCEQLFGHQLV
ncbi:conserved hypothetical protein [Sporisorium reilianum SRZ2]|uniref:Uncharacterized protein n=1 Tax=Sporisorium reilianum (strain SRZ2) TaxID=999809 RepID=E6ZMW6_SPORE|nr:conserved hypothetical protein [Sporisorium reilianum SRZ2]